MWSPVARMGAGAEPTPGEPTPQTSATTLYLVSPAGGRYPITTFPPPGDRPTPALVDWSGDGSHALFYAEDSRPSRRSWSICTPATDDVPGPGGFAPRSLHPPRRQSPAACHVADVYSPRRSIGSTSPANTQLTFPTDKLGSEFNGRYLSTPDGMRLVLGTCRRASP